MHDNYQREVIRQAFRDEFECGDDYIEDADGIARRLSEMGYWVVPAIEGPIFGWLFGQVMKDHDGKLDARLLNGVLLSVVGALK